MDRNAILASVLIAIIMGVWLIWFTPAPPPPSQQPAPAVVELAPSVEPQVTQPQTDVNDPAPFTATDSTFQASLSGTEQLITVETDLYTALFSSRGGTLKSFELKEYNKFDQVTPVQMVDTTTPGALSLLLTPSQGALLDSRLLYFDVDGASSGQVNAQSQPGSLTFTTEVGGSTLRMTYGFEPGTYNVTLRIEQTTSDNFQPNDGYDLVWHGGIPFSERDPEQEALLSGAYVRSGGEVETIDLSEETETLVVNGQIDWVGVKVPFFAAFILPDPEKTEGAELDGERDGEPEDLHFAERYAARVAMNTMATGGDEFRMYIGPLEYARISDYGLDLYNVVDYGFGQSITRPIARYLIIPVFNFLGRFIPNYGVIIILFAIVVKLALFPLTKSSYKSMAKMRTLQPQMAEIKEKYGDDPQKQQQAMMKMYKESGVNPVGSCLPQLLQLPILYALFRFFPSAIEIRQQPFLWASDLSSPDVILDLPFMIPIYGSYVAGFALLMGISLFVQMQVQGTTTPQAAQMKALQYIFPVMLLVFFNRFASGLSLYYLTYNVVTAIQQQFINKSLETEQEEDGKPGDPKASASKTKQNGRSSGSNRRNGQPSGKGSSSRNKKRARTR